MVDEKQILIFFFFFLVVVVGGGGDGAAGGLGVKSRLDESIYSKLLILKTRVKPTKPTLSGSGYDKSYSVLTLVLKKCKEISKVLTFTCKYGWHDDANVNRTEFWVVLDIQKMLTFL